MRKSMITAAIVAGTFLSFRAGSFAAAAPKYELQQLEQSENLSKVRFLGSSADDEKLLILEAETGKLLIFDQASGECTELRCKGDGEKDVLLEKFADFLTDEKFQQMDAYEIMTELFNQHVLGITVHPGLRMSGDEIVYPLLQAVSVAVNLQEGTFTVFDENISDVDNENYLVEMSTQNHLAVMNKEDGSSKEISLKYEDEPCNLLEKAAFLSDGRILAVTAAQEMSIDTGREIAFEVLESDGTVQYYPVASMAFGRHPDIILTSADSEYAILYDAVTVALNHPILFHTGTGEMSILCIGENGFEKRPMSMGTDMRGYVTGKQDGDALMPLYSLGGGKEFLIYIMNDVPDQYVAGSVVALNPETMEAEVVFTPDEEAREAGGVMKWSESFSNSGKKIYTMGGFLDDEYYYLKEADSTDIDSSESGSADAGSFDMKMFKEMVEELPDDGTVEDVLALFSMVIK